MTLSCTRRSPIPDPFGVCMIHLLSGVQSVGIYTLFKFNVLFDVDETLFHTFFYSELKNLCVAIFGFTLDVLASRFETELPWTFYASVLLKTVIRRPVVSLHDFKVSTSIVFLQSSKSASWFFVVEEELNVNSTVLPLL